MMIEANELIRALALPKAIGALHLRDDALTKQACYHKQGRGWFNASGEYLGSDSEQAVTRLKLTYEIKQPINYYIITDKVKKKLLPSNEVTFVRFGIIFWAEHDDIKLTTGAHMRQLIRLNKTYLDR